MQKLGKNFVGNSSVSPHEAKQNQISNSPKKNIYLLNYQGNVSIV